MPKIRVDDRKPFEVTLRYFKRACEKAGVVKELRERQYYIKPTTQRRIDKKAAISRTKKAAKIASQPRFD